MASARPAAFLFDLDGTLVDSVYEHVLAWREALEQVGIELSVWRIHRRIGMSGGLLINALLRETGTEITAKLVEQIQRRHTEAYVRFEPRCVGERTSGVAALRGGTAQNLTVVKAVPHPCAYSSRPITSRFTLGSC
jgi:phosphoglycolate phosphatase-like HAD superfamily hydrolase